MKNLEANTNGLANHYFGVYFFISGAKSTKNKNTCSKRKFLITAFACHETQSAKEFE